LYATTATRAILLFPVNAFVFTLTSTAAKSPSGFSDRDHRNPIARDRFAEYSRRPRDRT
jgi:hypothetical protein